MIFGREVSVWTTTAIEQQTHVHGFSLRTCATGLSVPVEHGDSEWSQEASQVHVQIATLYNMGEMHLLVCPVRYNHDVLKQNKMSLEVSQYLVWCLNP